MDNEDSSREYKTVPDAPEGSYSISGINSHFFPEEFSRINALEPSQRGPLVEEFYKKHFWTEWMEKMVSSAVVKRYFDASVNMGNGAATKILQKAINLSYPNPITIDGSMGPLTLNVANSMPDNILVPSFKMVREDFYKSIVKVNPSLEKYLDGWLIRASK